MTSIELFRAPFDVGEDLSSDTGLNGDKKTDKCFVFNNRLGKFSIFTVSGVDGHVGDDSI